VSAEPSPRQPDQQVVAELQRQMNHEIAAAHAYTAMALWCYQQNFKGFAAFFLKQAGEEREHAQRFMNHMLDRGAAPRLAAVPEPPATFDNVLSVARKALAMEQANTDGVNQAYIVAQRQNDLPAQVMLQWFISEQVEEEDWASELVERVQAAGCSGSMRELDRHLPRLLEMGFGDAS
jgi:ferritin